MLNAVALNAILDVDELLEYNGLFCTGLDRKIQVPNDSEDPCKGTQGNRSNSRLSARQFFGGNGS